MKPKEITITGNIHNLGYRLFLLSEAEKLFIEKFDARNVLVVNPKKQEQHLIVLVAAEAEDKISRFVGFTESNYPPEASVDSVAVKDYAEEVRGIDSFRQKIREVLKAKIEEDLGWIKEWRK